MIRPRVLVSICLASAMLVASQPAAAIASEPLSAKAIGKAVIADVGKSVRIPGNGKTGRFRVPDKSPRATSSFVLVDNSQKNCGKKPELRCGILIEVFSSSTSAQFQLDQIEQKNEQYRHMQGSSYNGFIECSYIEGAALIRMKKTALSAKGCAKYRDAFYRVTG